MNIVWAKRPVVWLTAVVALLIAGALLICPASGDDSANLGEPKLNGIAEDGTVVDLDEGSYVNPRSWPARGDLLDDKDLLRRAVDHWRKHEDKGTISLVNGVTDFWWPERRSEVDVIYAGVDHELSSNVVIMHYDGMLAKYRERAGSGQSSGHLDLLNMKQPIQGDGFMVPRIDTIFLGVDPQYGSPQFLVSPSITKLEVTTNVSRADKPWRKVSVRNGLATIPQFPFERTRPCNFGVFIRTVNKAGQSVVYMHSNGEFLPVATTTDGITLRDNMMRCVEPGDGIGASQLTIKALWTGLLPEDSRQVAILSERAETGGVRPIRWQTSFIPDGGSKYERSIDSEWTEDEGDTEPPEAAALWWYGKSSGRWYLVVAGASNVASLRVSGDLPVKETQGRILIVPGPKGPKHRPPESKVTVEARGSKAELLRVLWTDHA